MRPFILKADYTTKRIQGVPFARNSCHFPDIVSNISRILLVATLPRTEEIFIDEPAINDENIYVPPSLYMYTIESRRTLGIHVIRDYVYSSRTTRFPLPGAYTAHSSCKRMVSVVGFEKGGLIAPWS